jgi:class 3 adenylate cyclase
MAGVAIHANLTSQILSAALDGRALLRTMAEPVEWLWILGWSFVGTVGYRIIPQTNPSRRAAIGRWLLLGAYILAAGGLSIASSYLAFLNGWWIPVVAPLLSITGAAIAIAAFQEIAERKRAETERLRFTEQLFQLNQANERFVPRQFLQLLGKESIVDVQVGEAVEKEMSILFADIRSFTTLSEQMTLEENFRFINAYLSRMEPAILGNRGFIDKYIGDAIMALFNGSADDAVNAGLAMLRQLAEFNLTWQRCDRPQLRIGIGINTGLLMLGMVGGYNRMDSTVISDAVNLAYRLEGLTKQYGVSLLISQQTLVGLGDPTQYSLRFIDRVKVKGKSQDVAVFEVFDVDEPACKAGKLATKVQFEEGVFLYHQHLFQEAAQHFAAVLSRNPEDTVAQIYLERTRRTDKKGDGKG